MKDYQMWTEMPLPGGISVRFRLEAAGLTPPDQGNDVCVDALVALPTEGDGWRLHPSLRFHDRLSVLGEPLVEGWGEWEKPWRVRRERFTGATWRAAYGNALAELRSTLNSIATALRVRESKMDRGRALGLFSDPSPCTDAPPRSVTLSDLEAAEPDWEE